MDPTTSHSRRSFLKRFGGAVGVLTAASVTLPRIPAGAADNVTATAEDMQAAQRYTVLQWNGPADAVVQVRQLQLFGIWSSWETAPAWTDAETSPSGDARHSGLVRTNGAHAVQARALTAEVTDLTIVRVPA